MQFILHKLQDHEIVFKLEPWEDSDNILKTLIALMEQVVSCLHLVSLRRNGKIVLISIKEGAVYTMPLRVAQEAANKQVVQIRCYRPYLC